MRRRFGCIQRVRANEYRLRWTLKGRRFSETFYGSYQEACHRIAVIEAESRAPMQSITWGKYWELYVLPTLDGLEAHTVHEYKTTWKFLSPQICSVKVEKTTWRFVQDTVDTFDAPSRQRKVVRLWKKMANMAVRDGLLDANPVQAVKVKDMKKRQKTVYEPAYLLTVLEQIKGTYYEPLVLLEIGGGLRHEEACALEWEDITEWCGLALVSVSKARTCVSGHSHTKGTKNGFSEREVVIGEPFASRLLTLKSSGAIYEALPTTATHNWKVWCNDSGIEYCPFGQMRSMYATLMGEAGALDSLVSLSMGHSDGSTKGTHYQQATRRGLQMIALQLGDYLASFAS